MEGGDSQFIDFFRTATEFPPYPYQVRMATALEAPVLVDVPTGAGKTAATILGWLYRRLFHRNDKVRAETPRRLVYCLPVRVLVEQTEARAREWLDKLGLLAETPGDAREVEGWAAKAGYRGGRIAVTVLMGGEAAEPWDLYPEREAIIIGTQDMLLSRALNRGYGMRRYRWPLHFGLLNNDCLWVIDEVQLMGSGLLTTAQLQSFRARIGTAFESRTTWMSATLAPESIATIDFEPDRDARGRLSLSDGDRGFRDLRRCLDARKTVEVAASRMDDAPGLASEVIEAHRPGTRTLIIVNTVRRALNLHSAIKAHKPEATVLLLHSRFRPPEKRLKVQGLLAKPPEPGSIIVSTQVIEAGVDVSSCTLFTELAPWSSLVQRFGRCNRRGEYDEAHIYWVDLPPDEGLWDRLAAPYDVGLLEQGQKLVATCLNAAPSKLPPSAPAPPKGPVIRQKDMADLFDTTTNLAGHDIDISRFVREEEDTDVLVYWRDFPVEGPSEEPKDPHRDELCPVPIGDARDLVRKGVAVWTADPLEDTWVRVANRDSIFPGMTLLLRASEGRYSVEQGWNPQAKGHVAPLPSGSTSQDSAHDREWGSDSWDTIAGHSDRVVSELSLILERLPGLESLADDMLDAARWHDAGKAHPAFQAKIKKEVMEQFAGRPVAKAPDEAWDKGRLPNRPRDNDPRRKHFRHELASGILALMSGKSDLVAYLAASHHGKVRISLRSLPGEYVPPGGKRFARGVWDGDVIPETTMGGGVVLPPTAIDLSYMDLGLGPRGPSWLARVIALRDRHDLGPFRLSFLEGLLKAADERASEGTT